MTEMKTLTCPGPPEHEFQIPKGRGRPPRYCDEHKPSGKQEEKAVSEETRQAPRKRPGAEEASRQGPPRRAPRIPPVAKSKLDEPIPEEERTGEATMTDTGIRKLPRPGKPDTKSRAKAEISAEQAARQQPDTDQSWPRGIRGRPMAKIEFSASELIPTGQYANVAVGPARITTFIDLDRDVEDGEPFFSANERSNLVRALNELAETVEGDVVAVQRNIVLESMQEQMSHNGNS